VVHGYVTGNLRHGTHPIYIGADHNSTSANPDADFIDGKIDEIRLETVARTPAWIAYDVAAMKDQVINYGSVTE
jgi:hypothetical protein